MRAFAEVFIWLGFFIAAFLAFYFYLKFRNQERMKLIEKGVDISEIYKVKRKIPWYIIGFALLGISLGFVIAFLVSSLMNANDMIMMFFAVIFGAIGIIVGNIIEKRKSNG